MSRFQDDTNSTKTVHRIEPSASAKATAKTPAKEKTDDKVGANKSAYASKPQSSLNKGVAKAAQQVTSRATVAPVLHATVTHLDNLQTIHKAELTRITLGQMPKPSADILALGRSKDAMVTEYLIRFIENGLTKGTLTESHLLPRKSELSQLLGVSVGTVQNAIRTIEDAGHVESKQRIGTLIRNAASATEHRLRKLTSKRDRAVNAVRQFLVEKKFQVGDALPSARDIADAIGSAPNTTRLALEYLTHEGLLHSYGTRGNRANWEMKTLPAAATLAEGIGIQSDTLIDQVERDLKQLIAAQCPIGTKLPSHLTLAEQLKVSIKTVHDAMRRLGQQGIVQSKRGRYGTFVKRTPDANTSDLSSLFVPVAEQGTEPELFYSYEKVERELQQLIQSQYHIGDRLPPMGELAERFDVSSNTIRKALMKLGTLGLVTFSRGRFGGTFVNQTTAAAPTRITYEAS